MKRLIPCMVVFMLLGCTAQPKEETKDNAYCDESSTSCSIEESADMSGYTDFKTNDNSFVQSDMKSVLALFANKQSGIIYFGYPKCPWCVEALPIMDDVAKATNNQILYVETRDAEQNKTYTEEQKKELISYVEKFMDKDEEGNYQLYVPFVVVVKDGKALSGTIGTVEGHDAKERKMKEEEKVELKDIYETMFSEYK